MAVNTNCLFIYKKNKYYISQNQKLLNALDPQKQETSTFENVKTDTFENIFNK